MLKIYKDTKEFIMLIFVSKIQSFIIGSLGFYLTGGILFNYFSGLLFNYIIHLSDGIQSTICFNSQVDGTA